MSKKGDKEIKASLYNKYENTLTAAVEYRGFATNICNIVDKYSQRNTDPVYGISCKGSGTNYYVIAQGTEGSTGLDPNKIWPDLTSKLRLK
jgi:hypothetical protein